MPKESEFEMSNHQVTEDDIQEMARRIVSAANPLKVILFGSRARETARSSSDVGGFAGYRA